MKMYIGAPTVAALCLIAVSASAEPAFTECKGQVGIELGYGVYTGEGEDPPNPYGLGLGVRSGYTLGVGVYLGAAFHYYLGSSDEVTVLGTTIESSSNIYQFGAEVGYDLGLGPQVVLRPKVGLGYATAAGEVSSDGGSQDVTESGLAISPGVQALFNLEPVFISADVRYNLLNLEPEGASESFDTSGLLLGVGAGITF